MNRRARTGYQVSRLLAGSWRASCPPLETTDADLNAIRTILLHNASAGLAWWRLRNSPLKDSLSGLDFLAAFKHYSISAAVREHRLETIVRRLRERSIEPILAKGWGMARLYPHPGLRPYGDFDVCVPTGRYDETLATCQQHSLSDVDIHERFRELDDSYDDLLRKSMEVPIGKSSIRVLSPEDHFRLLAIHALFHGVWKPVWLCDIALLMESSGATIDWGNCLSGNPKRSDWVVAAIALANRLLDARLPEALSALDNRRFPPWLFKGLLEQWASTDSYMTGPNAASLLREGRLIELARGRWPNPIQATIEMGVKINRTPRIAIQMADVVKRLLNMKG